MADQSFWQKQINGVGYEPFAPERGIFAVLGKQGIKLPVENGRITLPQIDGYEIVSFELV